jgi:hypothetical protein
LDDEREPTHDVGLRLLRARSGTFEVDGCRPRRERGDDLPRGQSLLPTRERQGRLPAAQRNALALSLEGDRQYYTIEVDGESKRNAVWTYRHPIPWVRRIRCHIAFWGGVEVGE